MKRLLITGGSGFLGGHLVQHAAEVYDVHATWQTHPYQNSAVWHRLDLTDINAIEKMIDRILPDAIIHNAAFAQVDACEQSKERADLINVQASQMLARLARQLNARFIFVSTDMVFDGKRGNYCETDLPNPINYYGLTKVKAENAVLTAHPGAVLARTALIYGTSVTQHRSFYEVMLEKFRLRQPVPLFYDQFRTPIWVQNLADCLLELVDNSFYGTVHLAGPERMDRYSFGEQAAKTFGFSMELLVRKSMHDVHMQAARPCDVSLNTSKAATLLKTPLMNLAEALRRENENAVWPLR